MQKKRLILIGVTAAALLAAVFLLVWNIYAPRANAGSKTVSVEITHLDGTVKNVELKTDAETLWDAMDEKKLIEGDDGDYGKWITAVDGETADGDAGQYWLFTRDGEWVDTGCDSTYIADGEHYEFFILVY